MNKKLRKAVIGILGTAAMAAASHASAMGVDEVNFGVFTGTTVSANSHAGYKSWADGPGAFGFGWVHTGSSFGKLQVGDASQIASGARYDMSLTMTGTATSGMDNPAFSVWTSGTADFDLTSSGFGFHVYSPVRGPTDGGISDTPSLASIGIVDFIGYSNSGISFTNGDGDSVSSGRVDASPFVNAALSTWTNGSNFTTLTLKDLKAGYYLFAMGGSCYNAGTSCANGQNFSMQVSGSLSTVPVPGAVWLFGSAVAGLMGNAKRKRAA